MNTVPSPITVPNVEQFKRMRDFFKKLGETEKRLKMMFFDDPERSSVGYFVFTQPPKDYQGNFEAYDENPLSFEIQFAKSPTIEKLNRKTLSDDDKVTMDELGLLPEMFDFDSVLKQCIEEHGWVRVDNSKELLIGFARYDIEEPVIRHFSVVDFKKCPAELQDRVNDWRKCHPAMEYRKLADKMLGEEISPQA